MPPLSPPLPLLGPSFRKYTHLSLPQLGGLRDLALAAVPWPTTFPRPSTPPRDSYAALFHDPYAAPLPEPYAPVPESYAFAFPRWGGVQNSPRQVVCPWDIYLGHTGAYPYKVLDLWDQEQRTPLENPTLSPTPTLSPPRTPPSPPPPPPARQADAPREQPMLSRKRPGACDVAWIPQALSRRRDPKRGPRVRPFMHRLRTGCYICRLRHKLCTEERPVCNACERLGLECDYSEARPKYMDDAALQAIKLGEIREQTQRMRGKAGGGKKRQRRSGWGPH